MEMLPEDEKEKTPPSVMTSLPDDVIMDCIAPRVPRCDHPILSLVSKQFRSLVASPQLYKRRSLLGCTEECVYILVEVTKIGVAHWYSLNRKTKRNILVPILSLPSMPIYASSVVVGSNIFVMGGYYGYHDLTPSSIALCIYCRTHTVRRVADMPIPVREVVTKVIDEKIYILGQSVSDVLYWYTLMVFDVRTETWKHERKQRWEVDHRWLETFSRASKLYNKGDKYSFGHKVGKWETDEVMRYRLLHNECVMDEVLYELVYGDETNILRTFDLKQNIWGVVKGLKILHFGDSGSHIVSRGKKLILLLMNDDAIFSREREMWCGEITFERREGGEIWGKVERCDFLLDGCITIRKCLVVNL